MTVVRCSRRALLAGVAGSLLLARFARADDAHATPDEAKDMAEKAAALLREKGADAAFAEFGRNPGPFRDRDLYVFVFKRNGDCLFNAGSPALVGKNIIDMKDVTGYALIRDMTAVQGAKWIDYHWSNPTTKQIGAKTSYVIGLDDVVLGVGAYKG